MKKLQLLSILFLAALAVSCSKDDDNTLAEVPGLPVNSETVNGPDFNFKQFFQETESDATRKGIVILAHGDDADENDYTLNDQCGGLAQAGYVAITTSYRPITGSAENQNATYKADIEEVITYATTTFGIPRDKVIIGGLSRGGNSTFALVLPSQAGITPITGIKGVILECSGGDEWKGSAILYPTAYMSNKTDDVMGVPDTNVFKTGLAANMNAGVASMSGCLIIDGVGHCGAANYYRPFIVQKVSEWLP